MASGFYLALGALASLTFGFSHNIYTTCIVVGLFLTSLVLLDLYMYGKAAQKKRGF